MEGTTSRAYGKVMWEDRWLVAVYWFAVADVLLAVGSSGLLDRFFELKVIVPLVVGLSGLFIALWLANRERNKRITENHFYKLQILGHIGKLLDNVSSLFWEWDNIEMKTKAGNLDEPVDEVTRKLRDVYVSEYYYRKSQIEVLNINTYVPADIRHRVLSWVQTAGIPLRWYHPRAQTESNIRTVEKQLLEPFDRLLDVGYFTKECDDAVQKRMTEVNSSRQDIIERVDRWKESLK